MAKRVDCPFCGRNGVRTSEHVWAQWLSKYEGARVLMDGKHGERIVKRSTLLRPDEEGRYVSEVIDAGHTAKWLPNVTVDVCGDCNHGWMSSLEQRIKGLLEPFFATGVPVGLTCDDQAALTAWATKSWMAYALLTAQQHNPFSAAEYRALAETQQPNERSRVWLLHSQDEKAHVGLWVSAGLMTKGPPERLDVNDNSGFCFLAAHTVVLFMSLMPPEAPGELADQVFVPPTLQSRTANRIWPDPRPQEFPLGSLPTGALEELLHYPTQLWDAVGLPTEGLTDEDARQVTRQFMSGADPMSLRRAWKVRTPGLRPDRRVRVKAFAAWRAFASWVQRQWSPSGDGPGP